MTTPPARSMGDGPAVRIEGLVKDYGKIHAVRGIDLEVRRGEVFGFLGPNGAGKTTTIRTLLDEIRPSAGHATIVGLDTHQQSVEIRKHVGYLPSDVALYPGLTGKDMLTYFANLRGGVDWGYVDDLAQRLEADLGKKIGNLSSGNRQKVGLIQAFMNRPDVLIMDEPTRGLDPLVQREFQAMMREVATEGRTVFWSSHTLPEVQHVADRVGIIRSGRLVAVERVADLRAKSMRRVEFEFSTLAEASVFESLPGVRDVSVADHRMVLSYDGEMDALLRLATDRYDVRDLTSQPADLEDIFLAYYRDDAVSG